MTKGDISWPATVDEAVSRLLTTMTKKDLETVRDTPERDIPAAFHFGLGTAIRNRFGLWNGNTALLLSCLRERNRQQREEMLSNPSRLQAFREHVRREHKARQDSSAPDQSASEWYKKLADASPTEFVELMWPEEPSDASIDVDSASGVIIKALWRWLRDQIE